MNGNCGRGVRKGKSGVAGCENFEKTEKCKVPCPGKFCCKLTDCFSNINSNCKNKIDGNSFDSKLACLKMLLYLMVNILQKLFQECKYQKGKMGACNTESGKRKRIDTLSVKSTNSGCEKTRTIEKPCKKSSNFVLKIFLIII